MPKIHVHTAFNLLLSHTGAHQRFEPGVHDVSEEVADHWYTKDHADVVTGQIREAPEAAAQEASTAEVPEAESIPKPPAQITAPEGDGKDQPDDFDVMDKTALRAFIKARDNKNAPGFFDEAKLRHLARNAPAPAAE